MATKQQARKQLENAQNASAKAMRDGDQAALDAASDKAVQALAVLASWGGKRDNAGRKPVRLVLSVGDTVMVNTTHDGQSHIYRLTEVKKVSDGHKAITLQLY